MDSDSQFSLDGDLTVPVGRDDIDIELPRASNPTEVHVHFVHPPIPPCDPHHHHHHDKLEWRLHRHDHHRLVLRIKWHVISGPRKIHWLVRY